MKKWLVRYLFINLLAFALPGSFTISILEFGNLISHLHDHGHSDHENSIFKFLASHYFNKKHHESNHDDHDHLPFKDHDGGFLNFALQSPSVLPQPGSNLVLSKLVLYSSIMIAKSQPWLSSSYTGDIWQPPKV